MKIPQKHRKYITVHIVPSKHVFQYFFRKPFIVIKSWWNVSMLLLIVSRSQTNTCMYFWSWELPVVKGLPISKSVPWFACVIRVIAISTSTLSKSHDSVHISSKTFRSVRLRIFRKPSSTPYCGIRCENIRQKINMFVRNQITNTKFHIWPRPR